MSTIQTQLGIAHLESSLNASSAVQRTTFEAGFVSNSITVTTVEETIPLGDIITPKQVMLKLVSGDPVKIGVSSGVYPFRLQDEGEPCMLRLDVEGLRQIDEITVPADVEGDLGGEYFILDDRNTDAVWVWFNTGNGAGASATGSVTYGSPDVGDTIVVDGNTFTCVAAAPGANEFSTIGELEVLIEAVTGVDSSEDGTTISITAATPGTAGNAITLALGGGNTGSMAISGATLTGGVNPSVAPTPSSSRLIEVTIAPNDTAPTVATAVAAALDADAEFIATATGAVVTVTDQHAGTRTGANANSISGLSVASPNPQDGAASPTVYLKSAGTSQVVVAVAPN